MDKLLITGGKRLKGTIPISGAKNAALPLMCAALLSGEPLTLENVPDLADVFTLAELLRTLGVTVDKARVAAAHRLTLNARSVAHVLAPYDMVRKMRASILVLGPLAARFGRGRISLPGGCAIGNRPVDIHLIGLEKLGAAIALKDGYIEARAPRGRLKGAVVALPFPSVGATENVMMAATLARGKTVLHNAAREPEIADLAACLNAMGAKISGAGSKTIRIAGVEGLKGATHAIMPDRIEAASYAAAAAITGGDLVLAGAQPADWGKVLDAFEKTGVEIEKRKDGVRIRNGRGRLKPLRLATKPFPGFATDMQAQFMALLSLASGTSVISETIFENRFMHVPELKRMGADIVTVGPKAVIRGVPLLKAAPVMATDLRASMCLVLAALGAQGTTAINRVYHLDRGYEHLERKLANVGAAIERAQAS
ncbi:MAG TPA: UDP-N-acetylglucosamine 1-carboxyvinyltransferase [Sphingomonadales bacterium]|nr:UDP-N-acetylglucosamine 1-carboxyvinyltransferase [Sphingomonadales bacterium]